MDLSKYVNKWVKIDLTNGFYYEGIVISTDDNSLELKDKKGNSVEISKEAILFLREIEK